MYGYNFIGQLLHFRNYFHSFHLYTIKEPFKYIIIFVKLLPFDIERFEKNFAGTKLKARIAS